MTTRHQNWCVCVCDIMMPTAWIMRVTLAAMMLTLTMKWSVIHFTPLHMLMSSHSLSLVLFILPNRLTYVYPCMPVVPLVPSDCSTLISCLVHLYAHHLELAASALQPLKSGTLFLYLSVPVPVVAKVILGTL